MMLKSQKVKLDDDREILIKSIYQWSTYEQLLCGLPTSKINTQIIKDVQKKAKDLCENDELVFLTPEEKKMELEAYPIYGEPIILPNVVCVAEIAFVNLSSQENDLIKQIDNEMGYIEKNVVWFQNEFCFPIDEKIIDQIKNIDYQLK